MRMRLGMPLLAALVGLLGAVQTAKAGHCGATDYSCCSKDPCCQEQSCFTSCQKQCRSCYKLVYDCCLEKRWHTCYKTVQETVMKPVCKTVYHAETKTCYKPCYETCYKTVECVQNKPVYQTCYKDCQYTVCKKVQETCWKECTYTVCRPVQEQKCHTECYCVKKNVCEQHMREVCEVVCKPIRETHVREKCCQVRKCIEECHEREVCCTHYKTVQETQMKDCVKTVCKPVQTTKTVTKKVHENVCETYCKPGKCHLTWVAGECCFDPCTCKTHHGRGHFETCKDPDQTCTRNVCKTRTVCETVPCTTYVKECVHEQVPVTVCKKVPYTETKKVPYTTKRSVCGAYVNEKGETSACEAPGFCFKEGAVHRTKECYETCRTEKETVKKQVPYTVSRCLCGAYVDEKGVAYDTEGPGRKFVEGAQVKKEVCCTVCRNVKETCTKKVPYTVCRTVKEVCTKKVPYTTCHMEKTTVTKQVPYKVCKMVPYTTTVQVPTKVTECVPTTVCKKVKECVCEEVPVKRLKLVKVEKPACEQSCGNECCHEGFLQKLFSHRYCCDACDNGGCDNGHAAPAPAPAPTGTVPAPLPAPKK